ncbi:bifunctional diguanylate cyclase/phosphodiesterase [Thioalkalivibrio sp. ALJ24]|uniref:putative bifunctional diguanylate cyclase/phosphodiesterase n=1 Tax=Thioalkalivibrio sp. ALJ24 TaxID=545276 RepID=UPI00037947F8|nr:EAL domain-containing protein [Thioalkalivibrio sp. ALJ24]
MTWLPRSFVLAALLLPPLPGGVAADTRDAATTVDIGLLAVREASEAEARWQPTADYLTETLGEQFGVRFHMRAMNYPELEDAVADEAIDFVLTNTSHYVQLEYQHGISRLTTLVESHEGEPVRLFGGVIFTRDDRDDITSLEDIAGQHLFAVQEGSLGGWHAGHEALLDVGVDPREDLADLSFTDMPHDRVVEAVLEGRGDVGMVRTGVLDRMQEEGRFEPGELRILEPRDTPGYPFEHTTRLFPEWPFARLEHADEALANAVTVALLEMPEDHPASATGGYHGWSAPLSYAPVHDILERLNAPPYDRNPALDPLLYWRENPAVTIAVLLGMLALMAAATVRYHRINRDLGREVQQRREAETRLRRHEAELAHRASHDPLTDLPNRVLLTQRLRAAINTSAENDRQVAVLFLDLDRFKTINDSLGHQVGDELLKILADRLKDRVRANTIARLGGDEFIILLDDVEHTEEIEERAREILAVIAEPFAVGGWRALQVGASLGITLFPDNGGSPEALITQADAAMYRAKAEGRNTYSFYSEDLTAAASERLETENRLRDALKEGHLEVFYQPQIDLRERRVSGVEALVRWRDPSHGLISPARFIPVAEETGLISPLGEFVLREACRQIVEWDAQGPAGLSLAVNVSAHQINDPALVTRVRDVLESTGMDPSRLVLEMTETTLIQAEGMREVLVNLKALGVSLAIDDFGTGYSSLAYLKRFNIDWLKIDRAFVQDLPDDANDAELAITIINMAHNLGLEVLAEGVETEGQRAFLEERVCDAWQGFLCSQPVPADRLPELLKECEKGASAGVPPRGED